MKKISTLFLLLFSSSIFAANVTLLKTSIAEEGFQMYVVAEILKKAGHDVEITNDVGYDIAYRNIADNAKSDDVYLMVAS